MADQEATAQPPEPSKEQFVLDTPEKVTDAFARLARQYFLLDMACGELNERLRRVEMRLGMPKPKAGRIIKP